VFTHRERVLQTLRGELTDRIPRGEFFVADEFVRAFLALDGDIQFRHHQAVVEQLDLDIASIPFSAGWGALNQPDEDRALESLLRWRGERDRFVFALIDGPFSAAVKARGFEMLMRYVHSAPQFAREDFQRGAAETRVVAQAVRDAGADGVILGEDMAYNKSTFFSPAQLRELYFPELRQVVRDLHALGLAVFFHSDGNLNAILGDLAGSELDGIQGLEPEAGMQIGATRERIGNALTLWGNLGFDFLSAARTDAEIAATLREIETTHGARSRLILGSCGGLVEGLNVDTVRRIYT
jgi:uroporphyrinogen decarboxylase